MEDIKLDEGLLVKGAGFVFGLCLVGAVTNIPNPTLKAIAKFGIRVADIELN